MTPKTDHVKISKSEKTRLRILDSFLDLTRDKRWDKISVKELCAKAEITRGTFYQYYDDIYTLMESLEDQLLADLTERYEKISYTSYSEIPADLFIDKFDYAPPEVLTVWFRFVRDHTKELLALFDRKNGDPYFVKKMKAVMSEYLSRVMDSDGHPDDALRSHFMKLFLEMHFLGALSWIEDDESLSEEDIVNLLNATRVGSCYLGFKRRSDPEFRKKIQ